MIESDVLNPHLVAGAGIGEDVALHLPRRSLEVSEEIASADLLLSTHVIHLGHELVFSLHDRSARKGQLPIGAVGKGDVVQKILRNRAQAAGWYLVVGQRTAGNRVDQSRGNGGKVAVPLRLRGHELHLSTRHIAHTGTLVGAEVEQLVFYDSTSPTAPELVALQLILCDCEELPCVQLAVPQKLKQRTMNIVGSGARNDVDDAARRVAVLRREVTREQAEFLDGVGVREGQAGVQIGVVVIGAVHLEVDLTLTVAVHSRRFLAGVNAPVAANAATVAA